MGTAYANFVFNIGDTISSSNRNLKIIDRKYIDKIYYKNQKPYNLHHKYYKYKCLNCGNEDWIVEFLLTGKQKIGCNACCTPPKKLVVGINDIATTTPWMVKYFVNPDDAKKYFKFSNEYVDMRCPDCGRIHKKKKIGNLYNNKNLSCPCSDGWSYPNKFMYSLLEQLNVKFETEKLFEWSDNRIYDDYIEYDGLKIITEQHGQQHYNRQFCKNSRTIEEEKENDKYKYQLSLKNGIDKYFVIDSSVSTMEHMKKSIINSNFLLLFNKNSNDINWQLCDEFATSNLAKKICIYKENHPDILLKEIAKKFHISYNTTLTYIKKGSKLGWCSYKPFDDLQMLRKEGKILTNQKPIHCLSDGKYYRGSKIFVEEYEKQYGKYLQERNIRSVCEGKRNYVNNLSFEYITQEEFNKIKFNTPELAIGEFFKLSESVA